MIKILNEEVQSYLIDDVKDLATDLDFECYDTYYIRCWKDGERFKEYYSTHPIDNLIYKAYQIKKLELRNQKINNILNG